MMAVSIPSRDHTPGVDSEASHDPVARNTIVVKTGSTNSKNVHHPGRTSLKIPGSGPSSMRSSPDENLPSAISQTPSSIHRPSNGIDSSHKRKRSGTDDGGRLSPRGDYDYSPPKRAEPPQHMADRALHVLTSTDDHHQTRQHRYQDSDDMSQDGQSWGHDQAPAVQPPHAGSEDQWDSTPGANGQGYDPSMNGNGIVPKRKRNFSNRTKTGCMTCRRRKKKCDEGRPQCQNCIRGSFSCEGYSTTRALWKPQTTKLPVPLQSKEGQGDPYEAGQQRHANNSPSSAHPYESSPLRSVSAHELDNARQHATAVPNEPRNRPSYPGQPWPPQQSHPQYTKDHLPPLSEISRSDAPLSGAPRELSRPPAQSAPVPPPMSQPPQQHPSISQAPPQYSIQPAATQPPQQPYYPAQQEYRQYPPPPPPLEYQSSSSVSHSRMSSVGHDHHKSGAKTFLVEEVERSRMLRNSRYKHFDPTLVNDRQRCERALARYNAACSIESGLEVEQIREMLCKVFDPARDTTHRFDAPPRERGTLSHGVKIEAPFTCTYGYNLKIMDNVYIGKGATVDDAGRVEIGPRTWIGPNVTILTTDCSKDMVDRKGAEGTWISRNVTIESEVVIGANAIIYPGIRIGRGSTVEPGAIVKETLGDNQIQRAADGKRDQM